MIPNHRLKKRAVPNLANSWAEISSKENTIHSGITNIPYGLFSGKNFYGNVLHSLSTYQKVYHYLSMYAIYITVTFCEQFDNIKYLSFAHYGNDTRLICNYIHICDCQHGHGDDVRVDYISPFLVIPTDNPDIFPLLWPLDHGRRSLSSSVEYHVPSCQYFAIKQLPIAA